jgi:ubiquinone/menaquinone biosynthesis C-methylase UbiE/GNAT superfamily N-acetyltransferase
LRDGVSIDELSALCDEITPLSSLTTIQTDGEVQSTPLLDSQSVISAATDSPSWACKDAFVVIPGEKFPPVGDTIPNDVMEGWGVVPAGAQLDDVVVDHWRAMWKEAGMSEDQLRPDFDIRTRAFIARARDRLQYQTFVAHTNDGKVVGSASCQVWEGPLPLVLNDETFKYGSVWAVYVRPEFRQQGIGRALMEQCILHWKKIGCNRGLLLYASEEGRRVYERCGFRPGNALFLDNVQGWLPNTPVSVAFAEKDIEQQVKTQLALELECEGAILTSRRLACLLRGVPHQLDTVLSDAPRTRSAIQEAQARQGRAVNKEFNWFTQNVHRFGKGFDMQALTQDPAQLALKFDRLSQHWEEYVTGCGYRAVFEWLLRVSEGISMDATVLDVACGIGLMCQTLRMIGHEGHMIGMDISSKMLEKAQESPIYDEVFVADANRPFPISNGRTDACICTGALELLHIDHVLQECARVTKAGGLLLASFQHESITVPNPTAHQNISGQTEQDVRVSLACAGYSEVRIEACSRAFVTPSPDGELRDVPYLFVSAKKP